jgi:error-prone DNA polymerase
MNQYSELHCLSNFTFLRGASHPEELVEQAHQLGYSALAITDECSLAGIVRAHVAAKTCGIELITGSEIGFADGPRVVLLATDRIGYGNLSELITLGRRNNIKGSYTLKFRDIQNGLPGCLALLLPDPLPTRQQALQLAVAFPERSWLAVELFRASDDAERLDTLTALGRSSGLPLVATGDVHMHSSQRRALQNTVTAIRLRTRVAEAGSALFPNAERHLRELHALMEVYPVELLQQTQVVADLCRFSLDELRYEYPEELVPAGETGISHLRKLTEAGLANRYPHQVPDKVRASIEYELALIEELSYEPYFLTVHDIVSFARGQGILCQGRGSAANSAVCYALHITEVNPACMEMLFERFISRERNEPPDIDVDFEHERREEVIQYLYRKYGRERAALAATVITYRPKSAMRDVGKALGFDLDQVDRLARSMAWWDGRQVMPQRLIEAGFDPDNPKVSLLIKLVEELMGFPRHLSQHVGGFVIARDKLSMLVPIENAAMPERTIIQWDKDDLDALGLLKIDVLALGMLSAIRRALGEVSILRGQKITMADIPGEDPAVYDMIGHADTVGVFQIESRAQMSMLPRMKPRCFYDLVIEVAIVRPGPIQGGMVHPYLSRRQGIEPVVFPGAEVREVLERTLGVPIFQEQVMRLAVVAAGFTPGEADKVRRSMAAWRRKGGLEQFERKLIDGMRERGYEEEFARQIFQQILGFGEYGFPESHAASFASLVYVSAWLKCHEPAAFACALLNSQPMGFYAPSQIVQDVRRHGVEVLPVDVTQSEWDCALYSAGNKQRPALRLGLRMVGGLSRDGAARITIARSRAGFTGVNDFAARCELDQRDLKCLAAAGALATLVGHRRHAYWEVSGLECDTPLVLPKSEDIKPQFTPLTEGQDLAADYASLGLTLGRHPLALLRNRLTRMRLVTAKQLYGFPHGRRTRAAGLVISRQRPGTASGVTFLTMEDETGAINVVVWRDVADRQRSELLGSRLLAVHGVLERHGEVTHLIAGYLKDLSHLLGELVTKSRDFH